MSFRKFAFPMASDHAVAVLPSPRSQHAMIHAYHAAKLHPEARSYAKQNPGTTPAIVKIISEVARHRGRGSFVGSVTANSGESSPIMDLTAVQARSIISVSAFAISGSAVYEVYGGNANTAPAVNQANFGWNGIVFSQQITSSNPAFSFFSFRKNFNFYRFVPIGGSGITAFTFLVVAAKRLTKGF